MRSMMRFQGCFGIVLLAGSAAMAQSPAPAATVPAAAVTSTDSPDLRNIQKLEDTWSTAMNTHDQYSLELVLSPLFVDVASTGDITTRNQQLAILITGEDKTLHLEQKVIAVRMLGDIAVANGTYSLHHKVNSAQVDEKGVFTHVFERMHNNWVCINSQRTSLREDTNAKPSKKKSEAEMPFHVPLFGKGEK